MREIETDYLVVGAGAARSDGRDDAAAVAAEAQEACGAEYRRAERRARQLAQRLSPPRLRRPSRLHPTGCAQAASGRYFSDWLLALRRPAERAMVAVIALAYLAGFSTRRVEALVQTLGIQSVAKSQVSELCKSLDSMVADFHNRPLDAGPYGYVWVDVLTQRCRGGIAGSLSALEPAAG